MPDNLEQDGGLTERLLARSANVGVVDVAWAQQHYARSADFVAGRFGVLGDLNARYGTVDSRGAGTSSALPVAPGRYAGAQSETGGGDDLTPTDGGGGVQRKAVEAGPPPARGGGSGSGAPSGGGGTGPTLQRKAAGPEPSRNEAATSESASFEKSETHEQSAPVVSKESAPTTPAAAPSAMRLAAETPRARGGGAGAAVEEQPMKLAESPRESGGDAPSALTARPPAREIVKPAAVEGDEPVQRKPAPMSSPAAEPAGAEGATSAEPPRLTLAREEVARSASESTPTVMRAARGPESAPPTRRSATVKEDAATTRAAETPFAISETPFAPSDSASASFAAAHAGAQHTAVARSTARQATAQRAAVQASESQAPPRLSAPEIQRAASLPLAPRMVLRKSAGASTFSAGGADAAGGPMPYVTPSSSAAGVQALMRAASQPMIMRETPDGGGALTPPSYPAPAPPTQSNGGGVNLEQITEHVSRVILRRLAVERERRGVRRWL